MNSQAELNSHVVDLSPAFVCRKISFIQRVETQLQSNQVNYDKWSQKKQDRNEK